MAKNWWEENQKKRSVGYDNTPEQNKQNLNTLYRQVMEYKPFNYDVESDPLYKQMADRYTQMGKTAMQDTMGQAAALTGGYGNSYAQEVGQQAYQQYLTALNDQIPTLYTQAHDQWAGDFDRLLQLYELTAAHPGYMEALSPAAYTAGGGDGEAEQTSMLQDGLNVLLQEMTTPGAAVMQTINPLNNWYYRMLNAK